MAGGRVQGCSSLLVAGRAPVPSGTSSWQRPRVPTQVTLPVIGKTCAAPGIVYLTLNHMTMRAQGVCFHLYSRTRSVGLAEFQVPELQRSPLDELCLQARPCVWQSASCCVADRHKGAWGRSSTFSRLQHSLLNVLLAHDVALDDAGEDRRCRLLVCKVPALCLFQATLYTQGRALCHQVFGTRPV